MERTRIHVHRGETQMKRGLQSNIIQNQRTGHCTGEMSQKKKKKKASDIEQRKPIGVYVLQREVMDNIMQVWF